jgi:aminoglycoside 6'-N-acetyltransferase
LGVPQISFRPLVADDLELLATWLATPHVARWWPDDHDLEAVRDGYAPMVDGTDSTRGFVVEDAGRSIGYLQRYALDDEPNWALVLTEALGGRVDLRRALGLDYLIGEIDSVGRGVGTAMLLAFTEATWSTEAEVDSFVVAVQQENVASWSALERAGFRRVWSGTLVTDDPSDQGPAHVYLCGRTAQRTNA